MRKRLPLVLTVFLLMTIAPFAFAQEEQAAEAEHAAAEEHGSPLDVVFRWINFAVLLGALGYLLKKPAQEFFESRKNEITTGLERGRKAEEEASRRMSEIEQRLGRLSSDLTALKSQAEAESAKERERIVTEAKQEVERVTEQSRQEIDRIAKGIEKSIKEKIADAVVERAGRKIETDITADDQKRIVVRFLKNV
jgi:F-type H+-transporting ATPase subunit b